MKANKLNQEDMVGIVAPSTPLFEPAVLMHTERWLKNLGLRFKIGKHVFDSWGDYAGYDRARLDDFHSMWADPEIKAVLPIAGGNGSVRLLPKLDFKLIQSQPKILIGYSDITGLLIPIQQETGLVTFHGPTAGSFYKSKYTYDSYVKALTVSEPLGPILDPELESPWCPDYPATRVIITAGEARGLLTGGCLTLIRQLMGTAYQIDTKDKIVFLEDVQEEPFSIDRMLTQLILAGKLVDARAIIVGDCIKCRPGDSQRNMLPLNYSLEHVLKERLSNLGIPVVYGLPFGHGNNQFTLPIGVMANLIATAEKVELTIEESALDG